MIERELFLMIVWLLGSGGLLYGVLRWAKSQRDKELRRQYMSRYFYSNRRPIK